MARSVPQAAKSPPWHTAAMLHALHRLSLIAWIGIALVAGVLAGFVLPEAALPVAAAVGDIVLRALQMLILPIVVTTVIVGINQSGPAALGRTGAALAAYYVVTTAVAMIIGLAAALVFSPGDGLSLPTSGPASPPAHPGPAALVASIVPTNIVAAFADLNMLAVLFVAIVFGVAIALARYETSDSTDGVAALYQGIRGLETITLRVMRWVLAVLPIGIFAIVAHTVAAQGSDALISLARLIGVFYLGLAGQLVFYSLLLLAAGVGVAHFVRGARSATVTAFATQSSTGTLPVTLAAAERLGVARAIRGTALPLGATINMDGAALRIAVSAVFAANIVGMDLGMGELAAIVGVGTLISIGTAGVPGAGIVMIATVFAQVGLPLQAVALLSAIDALVGMGATAVNVTGDLVGATLIQRLSERRRS